MGRQCELCSTLGVETDGPALHGLVGNVSDSGNDSEVGRCTVASENSLQELLARVQENAAAIFKSLTLIDKVSVSVAAVGLCIASVS